MNPQLRSEIIFRLVSRIPVSLLRRVAGPNIIVPYYHMISDEKVLHVEHLYKYKTPLEFKADLDFLLRNYVPISLLEILDYIETDRRLPENAFLLTFDDGYREMSEVVAPILLERGLSATFFVNSGFVDNERLCYLNKASLLVEQFRKRSSPGLEKTLYAILRDHNIQLDDIKTSILGVKYEQRDLLDEIAMAMNVDFGQYLAVTKPYLTTEQIDKLVESGFTIGGHSIDHPLYTSLSLEDQIHQTIESVTFVRKRFDLNYGVFAFPHTDAKVTKEFFARISDSGLVDLSFGTCGFVDDCVPKHLQRFSLEKPIDTAGKIIAFQHARKLKRLLKGSPRLIRH